ncbi:response regulator [Kosmotoga pacifica]|uniref:Response regulatory domain-containing protein n=1 Tax=Kosmotoga pacifica TaxID=1330330 RepID=A0A0G2Z6R4_9BACT|nr:response regulator [Kosmotoga pacifica]AKI97252.1 hypothetical protein IX53_04845 [Kosmotoga pacifica]
MKILFIDDSGLARRITLRYLKIHFPEAEVTTIGPVEFEDFIGKINEFQMVITDLLMPGLLGEDVIKAIRERTSEVFLVVLSANVQEKVKEKMYKMGVRFFLDKPLTNEKIISLREAYYAGKKDS